MHHLSRSLFLLAAPVGTGQQSGGASSIATAGTISAPGQCLQVMHRCRCGNLTVCGDEAALVEKFAKMGLMHPGNAAALAQYEAKLPRTAATVEEGGTTAATTVR